MGEGPVNRDASSRTGPDGDVLVLGPTEVAALLPGTDLLEAVAAALRAYSSGSALAPPRVIAPAVQGLLCAMPAYVPGTALAAKVISVFPQNHSLGMPAHQGLIALFDDTDGRLVCVMDAATVTAARTAVVSALAVSVLASPSASVLTIIGSGVQARAHLARLTAVHRFAEVRVVARDRDRAQAVADSYPGCVVWSSVEEALRGSDVVACCTAAPAPILERGWLEPGCHVLSVGSGPELDPATVNSGEVFVEWRGAVTNPPPVGAWELQGNDPNDVVELGAILAAERPTMEYSQLIRIFKATGLAVEDAAAARVVFEAAMAVGSGQLLSWREAEVGS
jgi:ornithine cyclodeaminase/alanine dehydrogenase-like protein (mu-crystallin family)